MRQRNKILHYQVGKHINRVEEEPEAEKPGVSTTSEIGTPKPQEERTTHKSLRC